MLVSVLITLLSISLTQFAWAQPQCAEIYDQQTLPQVLSSYPPARLSFEAWELPSGGRIFDLTNSAELGPWLRSREGTYPVLILRSGEVLVSHRLPDPAKSETEAFLMTHRSLVENFKNTTGREPDIIFAGEIRVTEGQVHSLVDLSGTYHFQLSDLFAGATDAHLILENSLRLEWAVQVLQNWGAIDAGTKIKNFWEDNHLIPEDRRGNAHLSAKEVSVFEMQCFANPLCWGEITQIQQFVLDLKAKGGHSYYMKKLKETRSEVLLEHLNLVASFPGEGVMDVLARPGMQKNGWQSRLAQDLPEMRSVLELP